MRRFLFISTIFVTFFGVNALSVFACSCMLSPDPIDVQISQAYGESAAIFSGKVLSVKQDPKEPMNLITTFKTTKFWKGSAQKVVRVSTANQSSMCGYKFQVGKSYVVYTYGKKTALSTTNCSRTALAANNGDLETLDRLKRHKKV